MRLIWKSTTSMLAVSSLYAMPAIAQTTVAAPAAGPSATAAADEDSGDIVVTALKRSQSLQNIPAAISALSGDDLRERGLSTIQDISRAIPNLNFGEHTGTTLVAIRGVGSTVDSGVTEPTVATYIDGVFLPRATMGFLRSVDLERVEVLRGPQGTLYGRNATGGAINFISQLPTKEFSGQANLSVGSRGAFGATGFVSGPLSDTIRVRLSGGHEEDNGFVRYLPDRGHIGDLNVDYVRGAIRFEPSTDFTIDLSARYEKSTGADAYQQLLTPSILPTATQTTKINEIYGDAGYAMHVETLILAGTVNAKLSDAISLRSITSYIDHKSRVTFDADETELPGFFAQDFSRPSKSYSQEFNLIGDGGKLQWILGLYYFHEKSGNTLPLGLGAAFAPGFGVPTGTFLTQGVDTKTRSAAVYGDATYSFTDSLRLNVGLRYNHENKDFRQNLFLLFPGPSLLTIANDVPSKLDSNKLLPKVNLQYDVSDQVKTYAQWSRGFKSGGQNLPGGGGENLGPGGLYEAETIDAYEVGLKFQSGDRKLTANFAGFYYDYSNLQLTITVPPATTLVQNAPARIYGLEGEIHYTVSKAFRLDASASYLHARFRNFLASDDAFPGLGVQNLKGRQLPHAPDFTAALGAEYRVELGGELLSSLTFRGDANYSSRVVLRYFGTPNDSQGRYGLLDLSATLADVGEKTRLRLFVKNVTNKEYRQNSSYLGAIGAYVGNYTAPRTFGAQLTRDF